MQVNNFSDGELIIKRDHPIEGQDEFHHSRDFVDISEDVHTRKRKRGPDRCYVNRRLGILIEQV